MSRARLLLHLAALIAPLAVAAAWSLALSRNDPALALKQSLIFGSVGALSAQIAAVSRWPALARRAAAGEGAWKTGLGMAAITHVLFGLLFTAALNASVLWLEPSQASSVSDVILQALFFVASSVLIAGAATFPLTAALAQGIAALRRKELADGAR